jgi:hypothetical protein
MPNPFEMYSEEKEEVNVDNQVAKQTQQAAQQSQLSENKAQEVKYNANLSLGETKIDFKKTEKELEGVIKTSKTHIERFNKSQSELDKYVPTKEKPLVKSQIKRVIELNERKIELIDGFKNKKITEDDYRLQSNDLDQNIVTEIKKYDEIILEVYKRNKNSLTEEQKEWYKDQFKQNKEMIGEIYSGMIGVGNGNTMINQHAERLMEALLTQVKIANEETNKKQNEVILEYLDKLAFIKDSLKELNNSKKDEKKFKEVANYYETYDHETNELTNTIKAAQKFVIITNIKNEEIREKEINNYRKNTNIKFGNGEKLTPNQEYFKNTFPVRL